MRRPLASGDHPGVIPLERDKYLVHEEVERFLRAVKGAKGKRMKMYYVIFRLMAETGARVKAALGLRPRDISNPPGGPPRIRVTWLKKRSLTPIEHELTISPDLFNLLVSYSRRMARDKPMFRIGDRAVRFQWKKFLEIAGLNTVYKLMALRHYHLMQWYKASNRDAASTQRRAGHKHFYSTLIYVHTDVDELKQTLEALPKCP